MTADRFIAVDWGTTNKRAFLVVEGAALDVSRDDRGALAMGAQGYDAAVAAMRERWGDLPVLIAGMAGSNRGWREVPYVACPATLAGLAAAMLWIEPGRTGIVPGVAQRDPQRPGVMRGEEVQFLGAVAAGLVPEGALLCQPGTHCKWASVQAGAITGFDTAMTGELFALLRDRSILSGMLEGPVADGVPFREGLRDARERVLIDALFGTRAGVLLGMRDPADAGAYVSGLLIGTDVAARGVESRQVRVLGDGALPALYGAAVEAMGGSAELLDGQAAFVAGMTDIARIAL